MLDADAAADHSRREGWGRGPELRNIRLRATSTNFSDTFRRSLAAGTDTKVTIEGAIEDIDVATAGFTTAVQCKYHEQADKFHARQDL